MTTAYRATAIRNQLSGNERASKALRRNGKIVESLTLDLRDLLTAVAISRRFFLGG